MDFFLQHLESYGTLGLFTIAFVEAVFSPVLPDLLLIPMALATPEKAIYYGSVATAASVLGGLIGYAIGKMFGLSVLKRFVPPQHVNYMRSLAGKYGVWAIFIGAMLPIPYKFITLTAGVLRIRMSVFILASVIGRAKRFLLEGVLIYYYGPRAIEMLQGVTYEIKIALLAAFGIAGILLYIGLVKPGRTARIKAAREAEKEQLALLEGD